METRIQSSGTDQGTAHIAEAIRNDCAAVSGALSKNYGSGIDHLWIDIELHPAAADRREPWPFRFQKRVANRSRLVPKAVYDLVPVEPSFNVAHWSVRPDYFELAKVPLENVSAYLLALVYDSTDVLLSKRRRFPQFDAVRLREDFRGFLHANYTFGYYSVTTQ